MGSEKFQPLPGFRDFYPAECAVRNYVFETWRAAALRSGFAEWEAPILESTDLYRRKSGDEIVEQLFCFEDKGGREVALRPELTPSLARMTTARSRDFRKPLKWFQIGPCFRYEKRQRGRTREFYQFNCDILGEPSPAADAELIALAIDIMRDLGFAEDDFEIRIGSRRQWSSVLADMGKAEAESEILAAVDKLGREPEDVTARKLAPHDIDLAELQRIIAEPPRPEDAVGHVLESLAARGLDRFARADLQTVRGLAYYTGVVFEIFALKHGMRAIAGGGRYDGLCGLIGGSNAEMPACGFAMGDVVLADLIEATASASARLTDHLSRACALDAYVVIADEAKRPDALGLVQKLRTSGRRVDFPLTETKVGKQFQAAETMQARAAIVVGREFPDLKLKDLASRRETSMPESGLPKALADLLASDPAGPLIA